MRVQLPLDRANLKPGMRVCVAISGGADSVALLTGLYALNALPRGGLGVGLSAVHVHHGLRGAEAEGDYRFVEDLCARLKVPLALHRVDVGAYAASSGETIEEASRTLRYGIFRAALAGGAVDAVVTAHTLDDQAETVLMKLLRGAWTAGLSGISPTLPCPGGVIVRPLLATTREQVIDFLRGSGETWRTDSSNGDPAFTRNRIRHELLPLLREENPSLNTTLSHLAELAREEEERWRVELNRLLPSLLLPGKPVRGGGRSVATAPGSGSVALEIDRLRLLDAATRRRVVRAAAESVGVSLTFEETARLLALCGLMVDQTVSSRPGATLDLGRGLRAERSAREIRLSVFGRIPARRV